MNSCHLQQHIDGPRGYYTKWNKSDWERQRPYDFIRMWKLKNKWIKKKQKGLYWYKTETTPDKATKLLCNTIQGYELIEWES